MKNNIKNAEKSTRKWWDNRDSFRDTQGTKFKTFTVNNRQISKRWAYHETAAYYQIHSKWDRAGVVYWKVKVNPKDSHSGTNAEILTPSGIESVYLNRRSAIKFKCMDCSGFEYAEMRNCEHQDCSIWQFRTGNGQQDPVNRIKAIKAYCMWCMLDQQYEITNCTSINCQLFIFRGYPSWKECFK